VNNDNHHEQLFTLHISMRKPRLPVTYTMQSSTSETCPRLPVTYTMQSSTSETCKLQCSLLHFNHYYIKCQQFA